MTSEILGLLILACVVALVFFTKDGRALFEEGCDYVEDHLLLASNLRQRWVESRRRELTTADHKHEAWE